MSASELLDAHFQTIKTDHAKWRTLFADDAVLELPFAPPNVPKVLSGIDAIAESVSGFFSALGDDFKIKKKAICKIEGEDAVFAEFAVTATVIPTKKFYEQDYVLYLRAKDGKIVLYREYFDGLRTAAAFTPDN